MRSEKSMERHPSGCHGAEGHGASAPDGGTLDEILEQETLRRRLVRIRHKIVVLSGKGGVGKSTVAVSLATALREAGKRVGLLDVDIHGPSIPIMLGLEGAKVENGPDGLLPVDAGGIKVVSLGFMLQGRDDAVIWRGPMKMGAIRQFLTDTDWGDLDYLIIDSPPGTGDEPLSVCQLIDRLDGAVIVTTPQRVATADVRRSVTFCRRLGVGVLGVVENMSGFVCPKCGELTPILCSGGGRHVAEDMQIPFLGSIPLDPRIAETGDRGRAFVRDFAGSPAAYALGELVKPVLALEGDSGEPARSPVGPAAGSRRRIAIPLEDGRLTLHFGHCERFALVDVDLDEKRVLKREDMAAPPHRPGSLPSWLAGHGVDTVIAGDMGQRALGLFADKGILAVVGVDPDTPERLAEAYLARTLRTGGNTCDH